MPRHQIAADLVISARVEKGHMFTSFSNLMKMELAPLYSISAILSMAAHEWRTGMAFLASTEPVTHFISHDSLFIEGLLECVHKCSSALIIMVHRALPGEKQPTTPAD